jgi:dUTPase
MREDFLAFEKEKELVQVNYFEPCKDYITVRIRYSVIHPSCSHPSKQEASPGINIPVQQEVILPPAGQMTVDTGIQLILPANLCAQLIPHHSSSEVNLFVHSEFVHSNFSSTIKLLLRNNSSTTVKIEQGTSLVQALILPILHPTLIHESSIQSYSTRLDDRTDQELRMRN